MRKVESETLFRKHTDPLWIQNHLLPIPHNTTASNATATFVKRKDRRYVLTCRHVLKELEKLKGSNQLPHAALTLLVNDSLEAVPSHITQQVIEVNPQAPEPQFMENEVDIALAPIDDRNWELLSGVKKKAVIDLDDWRAPNWNRIGYCLAAGYPDEHKGISTHNNVLVVTTKLVTVIAEIKEGEGPAPNNPEFTFHDRVKDLKGYTFSGMSGGPVYAVEGREQRCVEDEELFPVGIAFEGRPSTNKPGTENQHNKGVFLSQGDFYIRACILTPRTFDEWLARTGLEAEAN